VGGRIGQISPCGHVRGASVYFSDCLSRLGLVAVVDGDSPLVVSYFEHGAALLYVNPADKNHNRINFQKLQRFTLISLINGSDFSDFTQSDPIKDKIYSDIFFLEKEKMLFINHADFDRSEI
jgi:hypothetical protein